MYLLTGLHGLVAGADEAQETVYALANWPDDRLAPAVSLFRVVSPRFMVNPSLALLRPRPSCTLHRPGPRPPCDVHWRFEGTPLPPSHTVAAEPVAAFVNKDHAWLYAGSGAKRAEHCPGSGLGPRTIVVSLVSPSPSSASTFPISPSAGTGADAGAGAGAGGKGQGQEGRTGARSGAR